MRGATSGLLTLQNTAKEANLPLPVDVDNIKSQLTKDDLFGSHAILGILQLITQLVDLILHVEVFGRRTIL